MGKKAKIILNVESHCLIPKHIKISETEKKKVLDCYKISVKELPKILITDPALANLDVKVGDVIKIFRKSETSKDTIYYRGVMSE